MNNEDNRMYYIVDSYGSYYWVNENNQLVIASCREQATVFGYDEAKQRIGGGKRTHFYATVPVDTINESSEQPLSLPYDMRSMDWEEYLTHFCYITSSIPAYMEELNQALSNIDMQICDIMHYVELYDVDYEESDYLIKLLKECREQRRDVKDERDCVDCFQRTIGTDGNVAKVQEGVKQLHKLCTRKYHPRKLQELFAECPKQTSRPSKLKRAFGKETCMDFEADRKRSSWGEQKEGVIVEYTRQRTKFDGKENDWKQFARQQAQFYADAGQYIYNLEADIQELDSGIERMLGEIESASYNAAQGYNVLKQLKELRNARKEKQTELECMYILTDRFDCEALADEMQVCVNKIETLLGDTEDLEKVVGTVMAG